MKTKVWAHRGASAYAPENTLEAFELAIKQGADGIELDVQLSKDGRLVVIHDEKIDRVCYCKGYVKDYTLKELKELNVNKNFPELGKTLIPTLEEVFLLIKPTKLCINVELKTSLFFYPGIEEKVVTLAKEMGMEDRIIYSSFNHYSLMNVRKIFTDAKIGLLHADTYIDMPEYGVKAGANALHPALYILQIPDYIKSCKEKGLAINVWTVNDEEHMKSLVENGIDAIITNYPDTARRVVDEI